MKHQTTNYLKIRKTAIVFLSTVILSFSLFATGEGENNPYGELPEAELSILDYINQAVRNNEKIKLDLFVMSKCPYGVEAEKAIIPLVEQNPNIVDLNIYYIADETKPGEFESMHGQAEVDESIRQLVISKLYPDRFYDYLLQRADNYYDDNWKETAAGLDIDASRIELVVAREETKNLFRINISKSNMLAVNASPTLYIAGQEYHGNIMDINATIKGLDNDQCTRDNIGDSTCVKVLPPEKVWVINGEIVPAFTRGARYVFKGSFHVCQDVNGYPEWVDLESFCEPVFAIIECELGETKCKTFHPLTYFYEEEAGECVKYLQRYVYKCVLEIGTSDHIWVNTWKDCSKRSSSLFDENPAFDEKCARCDEKLGVVPEPAGTFVDECTECDGEGGLREISTEKLCQGKDCGPDGCGGTCGDCDFCWICADGICVWDDTQDPGMCRQCINGEDKPDDDEDPGWCWKCKDGKETIDDDEDPGFNNSDPNDPYQCKKCENGVSVSVVGPYKCDDGDPCTENDRCENGECISDPINCSECQKCDNGDCIADDTAICDDNDPCTKNDRCVNGICIGDAVTSAENPDCGGGGN